MKYLLLLFSFSSYLFGAATSEHEVKLLADDKSVTALLDLNQTDAITGETFRSIAENNKKAGLETLLAHVQTDKSAHVHDAFAFDRKLFGNPTPSIEAKELTDPLTKEPISNIRYFMMTSPTASEALTIGSLEGMRVSPERKRFVEALFLVNNAKIPAERRFPLFLDIGGYYAFGVGVRHKDRTQARYWYDKASKQDIDVRSQARANYLMGLLDEDEGNLERARVYFEKAAEQEASKGSREYAQLHLAHLDKKAGELDLAAKRYRALVREATIPEVKADAQNKLIRIEAIYQVQREARKLQAHIDYEQQFRHSDEN